MILKTEQISDTVKVVISEINPFSAERSPKEYYEDRGNKPVVHLYEHMIKKSFMGVPYWSTVGRRRDVVARNRMPNIAENVSLLLAAGKPLSVH